MVSDNSKLMLAIHEQCEIVQEVIGKNYDNLNPMGSYDNPNPTRLCIEVTKEISYLSSLLIAYIIKSHSL